MKLTINNIVLLVWVVLTSGCKSIEIPDRPPVITQQATACYGSCPVYTIHIYDNRTVSLNAEKFLPLQGNYKTRLKEKDYEKLLNLFETTIYDFKDEYKSQISDMPTVYLTFNYNNRQKQIMDYYGAPAELKQIEQEVFSLINTLKWKKAP